MNRRYFSLVELLTVITVIAILAGIAIPVVMHMSSKGKETKARAEMNAIKLGLTQFKSDYGVWPIPKESTVKGYIDSSSFTNASEGGANLKDLFLKTRYLGTETDSSYSGKSDSIYNELMQILTMTKTDGDSYTSTDNPNTKRTRYLDPSPKKVTDITETEGFFKLDPWGRRYNIALDWNYDGKMVLPRGKEDDDFLYWNENSKTETIRESVAIYSYGNSEANDDTSAFLYTWKTSGEDDTVD